MDAVRQYKPTIIALDFESVLIPELWIAVAEHTGIEKLRLTTRDVSDYQELMNMRLALLREHGITLLNIQKIIGSVGPLPGAREFLNSLRRSFQVVILSDTFYEFAHPLLEELGWPTLLCHTLEADSAGNITGYHLRKGDKRDAVEAFKQLGFKVYAAGDSHNDLAMLTEADRGSFFNAPEALTAQHPELPAFYTYENLEAFLAGEKEE